MLANHLFARKPEFAVVGTGRCGTGYTARYLSESGVPCSHEGYYTTRGPTLRNSKRDHRSRGDASWLAVPFLPDPDILVLHQVRHPLAVIGSFYRIGFFDPNFYSKHRLFVDFASHYFTFSDVPLRSCVRWYIEWNRKCERVASKRFQVERIDSEEWDLLARIGLSVGSSSPVLSRKVNSRGRIVSETVSDLESSIRGYPEFSALKDMADRYGYDTSTW